MARHAKKRAPVRPSRNITPDPYKDMPPKAEGYGEFRFKCNLRFKNKKQKELFNSIMENRITFVRGPAGTAKTYISLYAALETIKNPDFNINQIVLTKPVVEITTSKGLGALPGCQPFWCKVLTPNGWKKMGDLNVGDVVYASDGTEAVIESVYLPGNRDVFEIKTNNGQKTYTCDQHIWEARETNHGRRFNKPKLYSTSYIKDNILNKYGKPRFGIPRNKLINFSEKDLIVHPYILGCLLGDGSLKENSIVFCNTDQDIIDRFKFLIEKMNNLKLKFQGNISYNISQIDIKTKLSSENKLLGLKHNNLIKENLCKLNLLNTKSNTKFIPDIYKYSSIDQRIEILRGLLDTDGTIKNNGDIGFTTTSEILANDVIEIVRSLGGRAGVYVRNRIGEKSLCNNRIIETKLISYEVNINIDFNPFFCKRKADKFIINRKKHNTFINSIIKVGNEPVKCIKISHPSHLYITDDFIVTHNTLEEKTDVYFSHFYDNLVKLVGSDTIKFLKEKGFIKEVVLNYIRGATIGRYDEHGNPIGSIVIFDESQNCTISEMKTLISRMGENTKLVILGDSDQIDLRLYEGEKCGLDDAIDRLHGIEMINLIEFNEDEIVRDPFLIEIMKRYKGRNG